jgi:heat shock protein HslJ
MSLAAITIALALAVAGCTSSGAENAADSRFVGQWLLVSAKDANGAVPLSGTYITLTINPSAAATGRGPCNDYTAKVIGQPGAVFVDITHRSLGLCADTILANLDQRYITDLKASSIASIGANILTFTSSTTALQYHRVAHFMIGGILDITWVATTETFRDEIGNSYTASPAGMLLLSTNKTFTVQLGACPAIRGRWTTDAGEIVFVRSTGIDAACFTPDDAANRSSMMDALANGFQANTSDGTLNTTNPRTLAGLAFQRADLG